MHSPDTITRALARCFLAGDLKVDEMIDRASRLLGRRYRWLRMVASRVCGEYDHRPRPSPYALTNFLLVDAAYTRYADDLAFSGGGPFSRSAQRFRDHVCATVMEEGFRVHHRKTRVMRQGVRQHVAGLVVNRRLNIRRGDFDQLKAILTNCLRQGAASQNRGGHQNFRAHLDGRISFVEMVNPQRGRKLRVLFCQIRW